MSEPDCSKHGAEIWFDRTLCPEPCDSMHERCVACGRPMGYCALEDPERYEPPAGLPRHLSPSQINTLLTCGEQYRLERVVRVPSRPMWAGIGGTVVHKITEQLDREWYEQKHAQAG